MTAPTPRGAWVPPALLADLAALGRYLASRQAQDPAWDEQDAAAASYQPAPVVTVAADTRGHPRAIVLLICAASAQTTGPNGHLYVCGEKPGHYPATIHRDAQFKEVIWND